MNYYNIDYDTITSHNGLIDTKSFFRFKLSAQQYDLNPGPYVIYPSMINRELICMQLYKFKDIEERFYELAEKRNKSDHEKPEAQKYYNSLSEQECDELSRIRGIMTNSFLFMVNNYSTEIMLPYKYISILRLKDNYLRLISADSNEFLLVNPMDSWRYAENKNYRYENNRNKKVI